jgi:hypothetical protein
MTNKTKTLTTYDILELEAKAAQDKINAIKKLLANDKNSTQIPVVVQTEDHN